MSKPAYNSLTHSSPKSRSDSLKSPSQNPGPKAVRNGPSWLSYAVPASSSVRNGKDETQLLDSNEIFVRHTVSEVKTILYRLRSDVDAKQEELRLMVGERYRDLLQASTSIISMSQASRRVLDNVDNMKRTVMMDQPRAEMNGVNGGSNNEDSQLQMLQCLAAHLKLLLDASEHLWRLLERKRYLHAAWLFLLSRVVYRSLIKENPEDGQDSVWQGVNVKEQFPLVQRQWESVAQFRAQISHKATLSLREQTLTSQELCSSLLALHLLDSLPLSDSLDVCLKQRSRTLQIQYEAIKGFWDVPQENSANKTERLGKKVTRSVWDVLKSVLDAIAVTVGTTRQVFLEGADGSMIGKVIVYTQGDAPIEPALSIPTELNLSTQALLSSLPNSNHFLPLPPDIKSFRPFIDLKSPSSTVNQSVLNSKLRDWFNIAVGHVQESAGPWLARLITIKEVWEVRSSALGWLSASGALLDKEDTKALRLLIDNVCRARVEDIWKDALEKLATSFDETLHSLRSDISKRTEGSELDISPAEFLLSAPPIVSVSQASLGLSISHSSFQRFRQAIRQRIDGTTPFIDKIMSEVEASTLSLRTDLDCAFADEESKQSPENAHRLSSEKTTELLLSSVKGLLDEERGDSAQRLSSSTLIANLRCSAAFSNEYQVRANRLYDSSVEHCASNIVVPVKDKLLRGLNTDPYASLLRIPAAPSHPSPYVMDALFSLIDTVQSYGLFKDHTQRSAVVKVILDQFSDAIVTSLQDPRDFTNIQFIWDLHFLKAICNEWGPTLSSSTTTLDEAIRKLCQSLPSAVSEVQPDLIASLGQNVAQSILHVRLLLSPLVAPSETSPTVKLPKSPSEVRRQSISGTGPVNAEYELQPALNLVKPSARFGSLWVGAAAR
ncbi:hypothetical protein M0805_003251 [Coniferiporia weirii]|nr:hypothetical protein M0805_003251 [Coniferiporia weirii]